MKKGHCLSKFYIVTGSLSNDDGDVKDDGRSEKKRIYILPLNFAII